MIFLFSKYIKEHKGSPRITKGLSLFPWQAGKSRYFQDVSCISFKLLYSGPPEDQGPHAHMQLAVGSKDCTCASAASFFPSAHGVIPSFEEQPLNP